MKAPLDNQVSVDRYRRCFSWPVGGKYAQDIPNKNTYYRLNAFNAAWSICAKDVRWEAYFSERVG